MSQRLILLTSEGANAPPAEPGEAAPDKRIVGTPQTVTYNHWTGEGERLYCGIWESTPGKVRIDYTEWEFCHFLAGEAVLTNEAGESWRLREGDGFIIPPGFRGTWETVRPVRKQYVILLPKAGD